MTRDRLRRAAFPRRAGPVLSIAAALLAVLAPVLQAQGLPRAAPEDVGLSPERLDRLQRIVDGYVDDGEIAGAVSLVARRGREAHLQTYGMADRSDGEAMTADAIFRIASMTKPVTSVAVMMLYEEGHFRLGDPIGQYLPALDSLQVLEATDTPGQRYRRVPTERPVTIRHLLTHTSGITYRFMGAELLEPGPKQRHLSGLYAEAGIGDGLSEYPITLKKQVEKLGKLPLLHQPGERFSYGLNTDVLGRLVEVLSGMPLNRFLSTRIFEPLEMKDTHFYLPPRKEDRLAAVYSPAPDGGLSEVEGTVAGDYLIYSSTYSTGDERTYYSGGAGLSSTARDYSRFLQMLLNGGELEGARLLSPVTVGMMTTDHIGDVPSGPVEPGTGGFGLGFAISGPPSEIGELGAEGAYSWAGFFNTTFWVDPANELIGVLMTQLFPNPTDVQETFRIMTYQSVVER